MEKVSVKDFPNIKIGIIASIVYVFLVFLDLGFQSKYRTITQTWSIIPLILLVIYFLYCIYNIHKILKKTTNGGYPISPDAAAFRMLIPFYNLYWFFKWPNEIANFINKNSKNKKLQIEKNVSGIIMSLLIITAFIPIPIGDMVFFRIFNVFGFFFYFLLLNNFTKKIKGVLNENQLLEE